MNTIHAWASITHELQAVVNVYNYCIDTSYHILANIAYFKGLIIIQPKKKKIFVLLRQKNYNLIIVRQLYLPCSNILRFMNDTKSCRSIQNISEKFS